MCIRDSYKGMLHQPEPDKAPDMLAGIIAIRKMHIRAMAETGLTAADEMLYPENRSYLDDLLSYEAVGARSVENQQHRLTASGMDIPVGMKNPTSGDLSVMLNAVIAAQSGHTFIYRGYEVATSGNELALSLIHISDACISCGKCERGCVMGKYQTGGRQTDMARGLHPLHGMY